MVLLFFNTRIMAKEEIIEITQEQYKRFRQAQDAMYMLDLLLKEREEDNETSVKDKHSIKYYRSLLTGIMDDLQYASF